MIGLSRVTLNAADMRLECVEENEPTREAPDDAEDIEPHQECVEDRELNEETPEEAVEVCAVRTSSNISL